jgi:hypothetical protein
VIALVVEAATAEDLRVAMRAPAVPLAPLPTVSPTSQFLCRGADAHYFTDVCSIGRELPAAQPALAPLPHPVAVRPAVSTDEVARLKQQPEGFSFASPQRSPSAPGGTMFIWSLDRASSSTIVIEDGQHGARPPLSAGVVLSKPYGYSGDWVGVAVSGIIH